MKNFQFKVALYKNLFFVVDWDDAENVQIDIEQWETNWDDDFIEEDFSVQLQAELSKLQQQQQQTTA